MADLTLVPQDVPGALDFELRVIAYGRALSGFTTPRDCYAKLAAAGFTPMQIGSRECAVAIIREYRRQRREGRPVLVVDELVKPEGDTPGYYVAHFEGMRPGDAVGDGSTPMRATIELFRELEKREACNG
jgi:hypothetical protein